MIDGEDVLSIHNSKQSLILWTRQFLYVRETVFKSYKQQNIFENTLRDKTHRPSTITIGETCNFCTLTLQQKSYPSLVRKSVDKHLPIKVSIDTPLPSPKIFNPSNHMTRRAIKNILQSETTVKS